MGEVYRAEDSRLGREVALKVLPARFLDELEGLTRFQREARALASLSHPNVAGIHEVGEDGGRSFAWSRDGGKIYYHSFSGSELMEVEVATEPSVRLGRPTKLFDLPRRGSVELGGLADGDRFLSSETVGEDDRSRKLILVQSWFEEFGPR